MLLLDAESSRARRFLLPHERLVAEVRWHPVRLTRPVVGLLVVFAVGGWVAVRVPADSPVLDGVGLVLLAATGYVGWQVLEWWQERLIITDRRIMLGTGILTRRLAVMPLRKVTDMTYERPLIGRLLGDYGWGSFIVESAGQDQALRRIPHMPHPDVVYARLSTEIFGDRGLYGSSGGDGEARAGRGPAETAAGDDRDLGALSGGRSSPGGTSPSTGSRAGSASAPATDQPAADDEPTMIIRLREDD